MRSYAKKLLTMLKRLCYIAYIDNAMENDMTYRINTENTGLNTHKNVEKMAAHLRNEGYDVEATRALGMVNGGDTVNPFEGGRGADDWFVALLLCDTDD